VALPFSHKRNKLSGYISAVRKELSEVYASEPEKRFRAMNVLYICAAAIGIISVLLILFVLDRQHLDPMAKALFSPLFFFIIAIFAVCIQLVTKNRLRLARFIVLSVVVIAVLLAITVTGGFPVSIASPAIMISVVISYCLYGGRASLYTTMFMIFACLLQWATIRQGYFTAPNYVLKASLEFNAVVALLTTICITCVVLAIFDASNKVYIRRAEASMISKTSFLANTSHEIRTPMNGIIGLTEVMLRTTELDQDQKVYMEAIHQSGTALMTIINDILDYSKLESGHFEMQNNAFNFYSLINEIKTLMTIKAAEKNIILHFDYPEDAPRKYMGDAGRIRQVLINLMANAIKFTENGKITLKVDVQTNDDQSNIKVFVQDTGIGIPANKLSSIFERFTQAESGTTQKYGGTGLGLSISQKLVEHMGGRMGVSSELGTGSDFWFELSLPLVTELVPELVKQSECDAAAQATQPESNTEDSQIHNFEVPQNAHVMVMTQHHDTLHTYGHVLNARGYRVFHSGNLSILRRWLERSRQNSESSQILLLDYIYGPAFPARCLELIHTQIPNLKIIGLSVNGQELTDDFTSRLDAVITNPKELVPLLTQKLKRAQ